MRLVILIGAALAVLKLVCPVAAASDFEIVASGPYFSTQESSETFDGTNTGTLPPLLDLTRVEGGSFRATYRFPSLAPPSGQDVVYSPGPPYGLTSFELLDSSGLVVYSGGDPFDNFINVQDNDGSIPFRSDQVFLASSIGTVTGADIPTPIYSSPPDILLNGGFNFFGPVNPDINYTSDLAIPTDAVTYLSFPFQAFDFIMVFGDGDYIDRVGPYQYVDVQLQYDVTALTVKQVVPEPATMALLVVGGVALMLSRRAMCNIMRIGLIGSVAIMAVLLAGSASQAALFTYAFTGEVTDVSNPIGLFTDPAVVGVPVTGSFTYTDNPNQGSFSLNDNFTNYSHIETPRRHRTCYQHWRHGGALVRLIAIQHDHRR